MVKLLSNMALACVLFTSPAFADTYLGTVVGVHDGDTITLLAQDHQVMKVRLAYIDAPELGQPYGHKSKQALSNLVYQQGVRMTTEGHDRYGRWIGTLERSNDSLRVNSELVAIGAAWVYRHYSKDVKLINLEHKARSSKVGLWRLQADQLEAPWLWRRHKFKN